MKVSWWHFILSMKPLKADFSLIDFTISKVVTPKSHRHLNKHNEREWLRTLFTHRSFLKIRM